MQQIINTYVTRVWQRTGVKKSRCLWRNSRFTSDMVACYMVLIVPITDAFHRKWRTNSVHAVTTHERAAFSCAVAIAQMVTEVPRWPERPSAVGRSAKAASLPRHNIGTGRWRILRRLAVNTARRRIASQRQIGIWGHSLTKIPVNVQDVMILIVYVYSKQHIEQIIHKIIKPTDLYI